ncbi:ryncolin-1-like [Drosophila grimshawi]|uniref:ryncolin-1-like n=1 Tax=Drosophila grimshawi TaxID=7222 RepID=UPI000C86F4B1|nr:ryncolin-1-like [Drosophila grimshawi]
MDGSVDFYLFWDDFKKGFGNLDGEFFIGLDKLHFMTRDGDNELIIAMEDFEGNRRNAYYDRFSIGSEEEAYKLRTLGEYYGDAGDSLVRHLGEKFSTRDRNNAQWDGGNCAKERQGAWWYFNYCHDSNLMGRYNDNTRGKGINWYEFTGYETTLKRVEMKIRWKRVSRIVIHS